MEYKKTKGCNATNNVSHPKKKGRKKHMKKNTKKKFRDIRNAVVMMCVMVAMMSTASYAWFTLTDSPTVAGMKMTAASTSGLKVANESDGSDKAGAILIKTEDQDKKILKPVHPENLDLDSTTKEPVFYQGVYAGNTVTGLSKLSSMKNAVAKYTYYIVSEATPVVGQEKMLDIGIICGKMTQDGDMDASGEMPTLAGSFVRQKQDAGDSPVPENGALAVRVGFVVGGTGPMIVWEPNSGRELTVPNPSVAEDHSGAAEYTTTVVSDVEGNISIGKGSSDTTTKSLFQMKEGSITKVEMYIWLAGTDSACADELQASDLEAQVQFTIVNADEESVTP